MSVCSDKHVSPTGSAEAHSSPSTLPSGSTPGAIIPSTDPTTDGNPQPTTGPGIARVNALLAVVSQRLEEIKDLAERFKQGNARAVGNTVVLTVKEADENAKTLSEMVKLWTQGDQSRVSALAEMDQEIVFKRQELDSAKDNSASVMVELRRGETALKEKLQKVQSNVFEEGQRMTEMMKILEQKAEKVEKYLDEVEARRTNLDTEATKLEGKVNSLRKTIDTEQRLHDQKAQQHQETQRDWDTDMAALNPQLEGLRTDIKDENIKLQQLRTTIKEEEKSNDEIKQQRQNEVTRLEDQLKQARTQLEDKQGTYNTLVKNCNTKQNDLTRLTDQSNKEQRRLDGLNHETNAQAEAVGVKAKELKALEDRLDDGQLRLTQLQRHTLLEEKEKVTQIQEVQQVRQQAADLEKSLLNIESWFKTSLDPYDDSAPTAGKRILANLKLMQSWYTHTMTKVTRLEKQIKSDRIDTESLREQAADSKRQLEGTEKDLNDLKPKYDQLSIIAAKSNERADVLKTDKDKLKGVVNELRKELKQSKLQETKWIISETDWEGRKSFLQEQLDGLQSREKAWSESKIGLEYEKGQLQQQVDTFPETERRLREEVTGLQIKEKQWSGSQTKSNKANQDLEEKIRDLNSRIKESNTEKRETGQTIQKLIVLNSGLARQVANYQASERIQNSSLDEKLRILQEQNSNLSRRIQESDTGNRETGHTIGKLVVITSVLARQATDHQALERGWNEDKCSLEEDKANRDKELSELLLKAERHSGELQQQRTDLDGQIRNLKSKQTEWNQEKYRIGNSRDELHNQNGSLNERVRNLQEQNTKLTTQVGELDKANKDRGLELTKLNERCNNTQSALDDIRKSTAKAGGELKQANDQRDIWSKRTFDLQKEAGDLKEKMLTLVEAGKGSVSNTSLQEQLDEEKERNQGLLGNLTRLNETTKERDGLRMELTQEREEHRRKVEELEQKLKSLQLATQTSTDPAGPPSTNRRSVGALSAPQRNSVPGNPRDAEIPVTRKRKIGAVSAPQPENRRSSSHQETPDGLETPRTRERDAADSTIPESASMRRSKRTKGTSVLTEDTDPNRLETDETALPWAIEDVRLQDFSPESIPAETWAWARGLMPGFDKKRPKWIRATATYGGPVCAINYAAKVPTEWVEGKVELGCKGCKKRRTPCILVQEGRMHIVGMDN